MGVFKPTIVTMAVIMVNRDDGCDCSELCVILVLVMSAKMMKVLLMRLLLRSLGPAVISVHDALLDLLAILGCFQTRSPESLAQNPSAR